MPVLSLPKESAKGRFLCIDPMADAGGQHVVSPYHAMACNPVTTVDPLGLIGIPLMANSFLDAMMVSPVMSTGGPRGSNVSTSLGAEWEMAELKAAFLRMVENALAGRFDAGTSTGFATPTPDGSGGNGEAEFVDGKVIAADVVEMVKSGGLASYTSDGNDPAAADPQNGNGIVKQAQETRGPVGMRQINPNDCVYEVLSYAVSRDYNLNITSAAIKLTAVMNLLGSSDLGVPLENIPKLASLYGYRVETLSDGTNYTSSLQIYRAIIKNNLVIYVERVSPTATHSSLIYRIEQYEGANGTIRDFYSMDPAGIYRRKISSGINAPDPQKPIGLYILHK